MKKSDLDSFRAFAQNWAMALQQKQAEDCAALAILLSTRETDPRAKLALVECARVIRENFCGQESEGTD